MLERADPRDVLLSGGARTRRPAAGRARRHDQPAASRAGARARGRTSVVQDLRGNVDTRIRRLREGAFDAILLARAGLVRLGRADEATEVLDPEVILPAPGQGAIALECRTGDARDGRGGRAARSRADGAGGDRGARVPGGAARRVQRSAGRVRGRDGRSLRLRGLVAREDGSSVVRGERRGADADRARPRAGRRAAARRAPRSCCGREPQRARRAGACW